MSPPPPREPTDAKLWKLIDESASILAQFVVPLYRLDAKGRPSQIGSGFFIRVNSTFALISAAHVLRVLTHGPLFYYTTPTNLEQVVGKLILGRGAGGAEDKIDVAAVFLENQRGPPYPDVQKYAVDMSYMRPNFVPREKKRYIIVGYPASGAHINPKKRTVQADARGYHADSIPDAKYSAHGLDPFTHVILPLDLKVSYDSEGNHQNVPKPQGMSGSPIWCLFDNEALDDSRVFPLVGVAIEYRKKDLVMVIADIAIIQELLSAAV